MRISNFRHSDPIVPAALLIGLLALPALLLNLGMAPLTDDEGIRALVALEMEHSGNYLVPTLFGEFYYNKPPLYNWLLAAFFQFTGDNSEFTARITTVLALLLFVYLIYLSVWQGLRKAAEENDWPAGWAWLPALAFLTCGRVLFWDSMLALIDTTFSLVIYSLFMWLYYTGRRRGWFFAGAYALTAIGFLLKGLPAIVFLGLSMAVWLTWQKQWKKAFSAAHLLGSLFFIVPMAAYYLAYSQYNGLGRVFSTLINESAKRTAVQYGIGDTVLHFFSFPFEFFFHFLPWTFLAVYLLRKNAWQFILRNDFIFWNALVLGINILPYWLSVQVYPRYLLMLVPALYTVLFYLHFQSRGQRIHQLVNGTFGVLCLLAIGVGLAPLFWEPLKAIPHFYLKTALLTAELAVLGILGWRVQKARLFYFVAIMLLVRLGYDLFLIPERNRVMCATLMREETLAAAKMTEDLSRNLGKKPLYALEYSLGLQPATGYYFARETKQPVSVKFEDFDTTALYIINPMTYPPNTYDTLATFKVRWDCRDLVLGRINNNFLHWHRRNEAQQKQSK